MTAPGIAGGTPQDLRENRPMPTGSKIVRWMIVACLVALLLAMFGPNASLSPLHRYTIPSSAIAQNGPHSYYAPMSSVAKSERGFVADSSQDTSASKVRIYEDGKLLGPAHSPHKEIADHGGGRFSHWGTRGESNLIFSSSDNSDPRTNGRTYTIRVPYTLPNFIIVLALLPLAVFLTQRFLVNRKWLPAFQAATIAFACATWGETLAVFVAHSPDSSTYYNWSTLVPLGYPIFLAAVGNLAAVPIIQLAMLGGSVFMLCLAANQISVAAGLATLLVLISSTTMFYGAFALLSESLFVPLLLVNLAAAVLAVTQPDRKAWPVLLAASAAAIMFVRPAGYYAPLGILFLLIAFRSHRHHIAKWSLVPLLIFLALTFFINLAVRGSTSQSQVGRILFPYVALSFDPSFSSDQDREIAAVFDRALEPHRAAYRQKTGLTDRYLFSIHDYNPKISDMERALASDDKLAPRSTETHASFMARLDRVYLRLFLRTVAHRPLEYLQVVQEQLVGAWTMGIMVNFSLETLLASEQGQLAARTEHLARFKMPLSANHLVPDPARFSGLNRSVLSTLDEVLLRFQSERWLIYLLGALSLITIPAAFLWPSSPRLMVLGYCGVMIHGAVLLTCATTVFIPRYAVPVEPALLLFGGIGMESVLTWARQLLLRAFPRNDPRAASA